MNEDNTSQDLRQFDVHVQRSGWFTVYAHDQAEAEAMVCDWDESDFDKRHITWEETEVVSVD